jgi:hypothetical protein
LEEATKRNKVDFDPASAMSISEKQTLVMKVVVNMHKKIAKENGFLHAFIATATFMPVNHLLVADGNENSPVDKEVFPTRHGKGVCVYRTMSLK